MKKTGVTSSMWFLLASAVLAQNVDIAVRNWTVPAYEVSGGVTTMTDITAPRAFIGVAPCRIVDTRAGSGFSGNFGAPRLSPGVPRTLNPRQGPCSGFTSGVITAYSLNVTVVNAAGPGHLVIYPEGGAQPPVSSINYVAGQTISNAVIVSASVSGGITVLAGVSGTDLLIDINGYFSYGSGSNNGGFAWIHISEHNPAGLFINNATTCQQDGCGVRGFSGTQTRGRAVYGEVSPGGNDSAGVFGRQGGFLAVPSYTGAGVRGEGPIVGVLGVSTQQGVAGGLLNQSGGEIAWAILGSGVGTDSPGVPPWAVFGGGNIGATGAKYFLDPHPTDPNLSIAYISLEGREAGTYFRGRARFQNGIARIPVPEDFRMVTDPEGLTVQITPIGGMATVGVLRMDLNEIVAQSSRNLEFSYLVQGVRAAFKDLSPLRAGGDFTPRSADAKMPEWLSPAQKRLLIQNGTYREDGSVNAETAHKLGWDRVWAERTRPEPVAPPD